MKIVNTGYDFRHSKKFRINRPDGSGNFILLIIRTPAFLTFGHEICHTSGNSVVIFKKDSPQIYGAFDSEYINDWAHFEADAEDVEWMKSIGLKFDCLLDFYSVTTFSDLIRTICEENYSQNRNSTDTANLYFRVLLMKISDALSEKPFYSDSKNFEELKKLRLEIFSAPQKNWRSEDIAKEFHLSCSRFQHLYKQFFGRSLKKDITLARVQYTKYLLFNTDHTVATIGEMCGYQNDVHFMRLFKEQTGLTPTDYRRSSMYSAESVEKSKNENPYILNVDTNAAKD